MAFNKLRGQQIKKNQITNDHIKNKLTEDVLDINFISHASEILQQKLVVDYVQLENSLSVPINSSSISSITLDSEEAPSSSEKGIVTNSYKVLLRNSKTGEPITNNDKEIFGYLSNYTFSDPDHLYDLDFYVEGETEKKAANIPDINGDGSNVEIEIVYPQRFDLDQVNEMFAANTKFVDGAADVTTHQNIEQITKDIFGNSYSLNANGDFTDFFNDGSTLTEHINKETSGVVNDAIRAKDIIDEVVNARSGKTTLNNRFIAIENHIYEDGPIDTRINALETELTNARTNSTKTYDNLDARLEDIETSVTDTKQSVFDDLSNETDQSKGASLVHVNSDSDVYNEFTLTSGDATVEIVLDSLLNKIITDVDNERNARITDTQGIRDDLSSVNSGKGASLVGIHDVESVFDSTTVEDTLKELYDKITDDVLAEKNARQTKDSELQTEITANKNSLDQASGTKANLNERLDVSTKEDGTLKGLENFHRHHKKVKTVSSDSNTITFNFTGSDQFTTPKSNDVYDLYINGSEQAEVYHYTINIPTGTTDVEVSLTDGDLFFAEDIVELKATIYATQQPV